MKTPLLDIAAHLEIDSPEGKIQVSGDTTDLTFSFIQTSTVYAAYKQLRRVQRTGFKLIGLDWFNQVYCKIVIKEREVAIIRLQQDSLTRQMRVRIVALRPLNFFSVLLGF